MPDYRTCTQHMQRTLRSIGDHFGYDQLALYLAVDFDPSSAPHVSYKFDAGSVAGHEREVEKALRTGLPASWVIAGSPPHEAGAETMLALPLTVGELTIGVLVARQREAQTTASSTDDLHLTFLVSMIADMLHQDLVLDLIQHRVEQLAVLNEIARVVSASIRIEDVLETIYQQVGRVIDTSTYFVLLWDEDSDTLALEILYDEGARYPKRVVSACEGLSGWVIQNRRTLRSNNLEFDIERLGIAPLLGGRSAPSQSWLGVPMIRGEQVLGALAVASYEPNAFSADDEELLQSVAAQAAIAIENARLYEQVRKRLGDLQQAQEQMISMSRLATSAELAAGLGHEINNALTPILGVTQLALRRPSLDSELQDDLERVHASAQRIRHIVRAFSEMATGRTLANQRKNINTILASALELFEWQFKRHHVSVELDLTESLPDIACDVLQLRQAVANILLNAMEAMPQGGTITISSFLEKGSVCARIADTGTGVGEDDLDRVFAPWFTTKVEDGRARGLGLGLFAAYNVVKAHGGEITLTSKQDAGTSVLICLPRGQQVFPR